MVYEPEIGLPLQVHRVTDILTGILTGVMVPHCVQFIAKHAVIVRARHAVLEHPACVTDTPVYFVLSNFNYRQ